MHKLSIKLKLILLFIIIKVIPLLIIVFIAYRGIIDLNNYLQKSTNFLFNQSKEIIVNTANESIDDSIKNLDKKSQESLEKLTLEIAHDVADFLKHVDKDILFLSKIDLNDQILSKFYNAKYKEVIVHDKYFYNEKSKQWEKQNNSNKSNTENIDILPDNRKEFHYLASRNFDTKEIPIYKEISFFDLNGIEKYKVSNINKQKLNISKKSNTYINSENYYREIKDLKKDEIYVSDVIGEYVGSKIIGTFSKENATKSNIEFKPEKYAYAGKENPLGKRFEGIVRFITPVFKEDKKIGYLSFALDHRHIMEFTDKISPMGQYIKTDISDASEGNYAFMWDYLGRNISHARDYFIYGYDRNSGETVTPWLSEDVYKKYKDSNKNIHQFLDNYPTFEEQSLNKKANLKQVFDDGIMPLDCRYLNFAPQCSGWMELTKNGGHGSFIIFWSGVWKLTTAAAIPYYTGKYKNSKRGFGFVTIGANVDEFHLAANKTKISINNILKIQNSLVEDILLDSSREINRNIKRIINELSVVTFFMIIIIISIALLLSSYISSKIEKLLIGTKKFSQNKFDYRIKISSEDEIGNLEKSFNEMAEKINRLIIEQNQLNEHLEDKVEEKTKELILVNETLEKRVFKEVHENRQKDAQLIQASRMATLGEMISMILHQWRQPLTAISMIVSSQELRTLLGKNSISEQKKDNENIKKQIDLMSSTMSDFRDFFKINDKNEYLVNNMIKKSIKLVNNIFRYEGVFIKYEVNDKNKSLKTLGYENELIQVLINIFNNARDEIVKNKSECRDIKVSIDEKDDDIHILISDFAGGIDKEIKNNIFNAYFTTKDGDKGTGLGLYMCKSIMEKIDGEISIEDIYEEETSQKGVQFILKIKKSSL